MPKALLDLTHPAHRVWNSLGRNLLQWVALDGTPARAVSRAYRTNVTDHERLHVQEAIEFLRNAPVSADGAGLSRSELDFVIARLMLSKNLWGGLMADGRLNALAEARAAQRNATVGRNWELLRTSAERAGLYFEPLAIGSDAQNYAAIWFPMDSSFAAPGLSLDTTWKLLHIANPWRDDKLKGWNGYRQTRYLDDHGSLLPIGQTGARAVEMVPLALDSLTYPRTPLLLIDFRDRTHTRRREYMQRTWNDVVSVLGLSHFANWYYFAGDALYQFVKSRRGAAIGRTDRLDCYSEFRVAIQLDRSLNHDFRNQLQRRVNALAMNPLESSAAHEVAMAHENYDSLRVAANNPAKLPARLDKDRRQELASFGDGHSSSFGSEVLHLLSFGAYTRRASKTEGYISRLERDRTTDVLIEHLNAIADAGPNPEVAFAADRIGASMDQLADLARQSSSRTVKQRASAVISRVQALSSDSVLKAQCERALLAVATPQLRQTVKSAKNSKSYPGVSAPVNGIVSAPVALQ